MKKFLTLCAAVLAAMSMNAQTVMDCDAAYDAAKALNAGDTLTVDQVVAIVEVTGYVTDGGAGTLTNKNEQTFYIGKTAQETAKTLQVYKGVMPQGASAVNKGDQVKVTGKLMHYVNKSGTTNVAELVNSTVEILQQQVVVVDTVRDETVCGIIAEGESLTAGAYSDEVFEIVVTVDSLTYTNQNNMTQTFFVQCKDNGKWFQVYNGAMDQLAANGDTVLVSGKIMHYVDQNRDVVEFNAPNVKLIAKAPAQPITRVTVAEAYRIGMQLEKGATSKEEYLVVGYVDSIATPYSAQYKNISFFMCDDMSAPTYNFQVYRGAYTEDIPVGTLVYCTGMIQHYYKAAEGENLEVEMIELTSGKVSLTDPTSAIRNINGEQSGVKVIENGQIYIIKNNVKYSVLGVEVK